METQEKKVDQQASPNEEQGFLAKYLLSLERRIEALENALKMQSASA